MASHPPCPSDELAWSIAAARLLLPPEIHLQAPPNLSDDLAPLLAAGIDDWGGVSPVTADHVNPERAWPALDVLAAATEAAGLTLAPRLTVYPELALDPERWLDPAMRFPVLDASDAEGLARDRPWCSGGDAPPACSGPARPRGRRSPVGRRRQRRWPRCWPGWRSARRSGEDEIVALFSARGPEVRAVAEVADELRAEPVGDDVTYVRQPQHQLHQRLHLQVPVLRLLQGPAVAEPAGRALPAGPERGHAAGGGGRGGRAPPRSACRAASTPSSTASTTSTCSGRCARLPSGSTSTPSPPWR